MSNQLAQLGQHDALPAVGKISDDVKAAIREVLVAFPSPNVSPDERRMQLGTYRDAVLGFDEELVVSVLKWLRFNNPRNTPSFTQPPTAQDVRQAVLACEAHWAREARGYFLGTLTGVPDARRWSRAVEKLPCSRRLAEQLVAASFDRKAVHELIIAMPIEALDDLPAAILADGWREKYLTERRHREYLRSLSDEEWQVRRGILLADRRDRCTGVKSGEELTEAELMCQVAAALREYRDAAAAAEHGLDLRSFLRDRALLFGRSDVFGYDIRPHDLRCLPLSELTGRAEPCALSWLADGEPAVSPDRVNRLLADIVKSIGGGRS